jgi:hypothetical protein
VRVLFEDLDELILRCRDEKARLYISEAIASYKAGAFRSSIVACWIAVCFDFIEKIRELALSGDKEAEKLVQDLDAIRRAGDLKRALVFERELLLVARDKFELLSPIEFTDLNRLQEDRNRCAHPSLASDDQAYSPSAELARLHLHSAVTHFLQHPPAQGKYALERLLRDVDSDYFPTTAKDAHIAFAYGPLKKPRESLVRNFVLVLTKSLLEESPDYKRKLRFRSALAAARVLHPAISAATLGKNLSQLMRAVPDSSLISAIGFVQFAEDSWQYLEEDVVQRLKNFVRSLPSEDFEDLDFLLSFSPLQEQARERVKVATRQEISDEISDAFFLFIVPTEMVDRFIQIYLSSDSFAESNACAKQMISSVDMFSETQIRRLLSGINMNSQIRDSIQVQSLIFTLRHSDKFSQAEFETLLKDNGLEKFMLHNT